ncbi:18423_t:CDS:2 [Acaulospora morrowiae]|uniref:18423_t:CDS:1 n=1 Tax=Acaulospora morrowiae TaxID=94023 RepID=A0A9N9G476_9GLOM|nr:18423_t:CDS:2 [Acaulospora morrowiae]
MSEVNPNISKPIIPSEDKTSHLQIVEPEAGDRGVKEQNIVKTEDNFEFNRFQDDLELAEFETRSIDENRAPWKPQGPWYHDVTKRRWFAFAVIGSLLVIVIIVGNVFDIN